MFSVRSVACIAGVFYIMYGAVALGAVILIVELCFSCWNKVDKLDIRVILLFKFVTVFITFEM